MREATVGKQLVTIVVVPRERFSATEQALESLLAHTNPGVEILYFDGGSPPLVCEYLRRQAAERGFRLIRSECFLTPNQARNLALAQVRSKYAVFIDNDAVVSPGWLPPLVACAEETGAWAVGPIYCQDEPLATTVHMAGGEARIELRGGRRVLHESHARYGQSLATVRPHLRRQAVEQIEFHCALVRRDLAERIGPLDERLLSVCEHTDMCLLIRAAGGAVYLEPDSIVTYVGPPPFDSTDLPYYRLRWSHNWNVASINRFREKWDLPADDRSLALTLAWANCHRRLTMHRSQRILQMLGREPARLVEKALLAPLEQAANRLRFPRRSIAPSGGRKAA